MSDAETHHEVVVPSLVLFSPSDDFQREEQFGIYSVFSPSLALALHPFNRGKQTPCLAPWACPSLLLAFDNMIYFPCIYFYSGHLFMAREADFSLKIKFPTELNHRKEK